LEGDTIRGRIKDVVSSEDCRFLIDTKKAYGWLFYD
jgi:hypothetical protein